MYDILILFYLKFIIIWTIYLKIIYFLIIFYQRLKKFLFKSYVTFFINMYLNGTNKKFNYAQ